MRVELQNYFPNISAATRTFKGVLALCRVFFVTLIYNKYRYKRLFCIIFSKKWKKRLKMFARMKIMPTFATAIRKKVLSNTTNGSQIGNLFDVEKSFWKKKFAKSSWKIWWFEKKVLPLHHFPLWKMSDEFFKRFFDLLV